MILSNNTEVNYFCDIYPKIAFGKRKKRVRLGCFENFTLL